MQYYSLKSILASTKIQIEIATPTPSFKIEGSSNTPYIEPAFEKIIYETEKPSIILISAVGATGKTALASQLSRDTGLPILDLGKHEPVGSHTLTGLLTTSFDISKIGEVFQGLAQGTYGIIIDGIDEGRSKVTSKAFEAFLDDVAKLSARAKTTNFILLGRTSILEDCWDYLCNKCDDIGLLTILPFDSDTAKKYVDAFTKGQETPYADKYEEARNFVLEKLQKAFSEGTKDDGNQFLAFIGYPPVLDSIVTLLNQEPNFHKLMESLKDNSDHNIEISLLLQVCNYILCRERDDKVIPNIVRPLVADLPPELSSHALKNAFSPEEQLVRLVAHTLGRELCLNIIPETGINERYENQLVSSFHDHPFLEQGKFRNAVFEALSLATLMDSKNSLCAELLTEYALSNKSSYHVVYILDMISKNKNVSIDHVHILLRSAMEFRSVHSIVEIRIDGAESSRTTPESMQQYEIEVEIELRIGEKQDIAKEFVFITKAEEQSVIHLGSRVGGLFATVPCELSLGNGQEVEILAPFELSAAVLRLDARELSLKSAQGNDTSEDIILEAQRMVSNIESLSTSGVPFCIAVDDASGLTYPIIRYVEKKTTSTDDPDIIDKYYRLKRILQEFRSHRKGALAKYKHKIEHERVLRNEVGGKILNKLLEDKILTLEGNFYFLDPTTLGERTGVTWMALRRGSLTSQIAAYLESV